jgi:DNA (cytosine-5)-methyltransferase 1
MRPKSEKFRRAGAIREGDSSHRSFKSLSWSKPSLTVAYGHREVHIHPGGHRRLSVFEAMRLQSFPDDYVLSGNLSSQIAQISEAVPPKLAEAVAMSVRALLAERKLIHGTPQNRATAA